MGERQKALNSRRKYRNSNASDEAEDEESYQPANIAASNVERRQAMEQNDPDDTVNTDRYAL